MFKSTQSKNELQRFLGQKNLTPQAIAEEMQIPTEWVQALYDNPRLLPNVDLMALFMQHFPNEDPSQMLSFEPLNPNAPISSLVPEAPQEPLHITICGCGNLGHVFAGLLSQRPDIHLSILVSTEEKATQLSNTMMQTGITVHTPTGSTTGKPALVTTDPAQAIPQAQLILLCIPSHIEVPMLNRILPHIQNTPYIGTIPAPGGFDWKAQNLLKQHNKSATLFGMGAIPYMCKVEQYGQSVRILGGKQINTVAVIPKSHTPQVCDIMANLLQTPVFNLQYFLNMTLHPGNQLLHPAIMYDLFHNWDGQPYAEQPLFYESISESATQHLQNMSDELCALKSALEKQIPNLHLPYVMPLHQAIVYGYGSAIQDPSTLRSAIATNQAYAGIRTPMIPHPNGWMPDWNSRFFLEDIPHGLVVLRGIADLVKVSTPTLDKVLDWAQTKMDRQYLIHGSLSGKDILESGAPVNHDIQNITNLIP